MTQDKSEAAKKVAEGLAKIRELGYEVQVVAQPQGHTQIRSVKRPSDAKKG